MTIEVTLDQVIKDWVSGNRYLREHDRWPLVMECLDHIEDLTNALNDEQTAYLLLRLLLSVPTDQGRDKALARLREEEFDGADGVRFE